jgi:tetratricopeptide (TPR) repeat protein
MSTLRSWARRASLAVTFTALLSAAQEASAQDAQAIAQARFETGRARFEARQFEQAIEEFSQSLRAYASPNTRLYYARSLREAGRLVEALLELRRTVREATDLAVTTPRYRLTEETARAELAALEPRLAQLDLRGATLPEGATLQVGEQTLPLAAVGTTVPVTPGAVRVRVLAAGFEHFDQTVQVQAGQRESLTISLTPRRAEVTAPVQREASQPETVASAQQARPESATFSVLPSAISYGVGVVGLALFGALQAVAQGQFDQLRQLCPVGVSADQCVPSAANVSDSGRSTEAGSMVGLGLGIAGITAGTTLLIVHLRSGSRAERAVAVVPSVHGASVLIGGRF